MLPHVPPSAQPSHLDTKTAFGVDYRGDADCNVSPVDSRPVQIYNQTLTANRVIQLLPGFINATFWILRKDAAYFTLAVKQNDVTLKTLNAGEWVGLLFDGAQWVVIEYGSTNESASQRGYVLPLGGTLLGHNPLDSTTYFGGMLTSESVTSYDSAKIVVPRSGIVKRLDLKLRVRTILGTGENVNFFLRLNDATDFAQITTTLNIAAREVNVSNVNQAVVADDFIALKMVCPAFATNPTGVQWLGYAYIEGT